MRNLAFLIGLLALPAGAHAAPARPGLAGPVVYEVRSWGRIAVRWQVNPDGTGEIWRRGRGKEGDLSKFRLRLQGRALQTFIANVEDARAAALGGISCKKEVFDLPYGSITWDYPGARQVYAFDAGCRSEQGDDLQDILTAASSNVETLAKIARKPYIVEPLAPR